MSEAPRIDPVAVRSAQFQGSFRKYDSRAVDQYLAALADDLAKVNSYIEDLERQVAAAPRISARRDPSSTDEVDGGFEASAAAPTSPAPEPPSLSGLSEDDLTQLVGEETAHVLSTARKAAEEIRSKAEESASRVIRESTAEAKRLRDEAEADLSKLTAEVEEVRERAAQDAEAEAKQILDTANADADRRVAEARTMADEELVRAERVRADADAEAERILNEAKEEGRSMLAEAKDVRNRILEDLQKRRDQGRAQIERLVIGRDRLLEAYATVRANVDDMTHELETVLDNPFERDPGMDEGFVGIVSTTAPTETDAETLSIPVSEDLADEIGVASEATNAGADITEEAPAEPVEEPADESSDDGQVAVEVNDGEASEADTTEATVDDGDHPAEEPAAAGSGPEDEQDVDDLFARIRADREDSVARAQAVLSGDGDGADASEAELSQDEAGETADAGDVERVPSEYLARGDVYEHRRELIDAQFKELSRTLKRHLADEQNEVLDALRRTESTALDDLLPREDEHVAAYAKAAEPVLSAVAQSAAEHVGTAADAAGVDVSELAASLGASLIEPFRRRIDRSAREVGGDHEELDERLRSLYREWKIEHIGAVATDALYSAYAIGQYAAAPDGVSFRWKIDPDQGPCPDAQDNALEGPVAKGEEFPTGDLCPQAHAGCHCLLVVET